MKSIATYPAFLAVLGVLAAAPSLGRAATSVSVGVSVGDNGIEGFHLAACRHYHAKPEAVAFIRARRIPDDHVPVVLFIADHARCTPDAVVALRLRGMSWFDISLHYGLSVDLFHVETRGDYGPPYGRALGHFKHRKRNEWGAIRLADDDVACLVNLRFLSAHHGCSADDVLKLHAKGESPFGLHGKLKAKGGPAKDGPAKADGKGPKADGKGGAAAPAKSPAPGESAQGGQGAEKPAQRDAGSAKAASGGGAKNGSAVKNDENENAGGGGRSSGGRGGGRGKK